MHSPGPQRTVCGGPALPASLESCTLGPSSLNCTGYSSRHLSPQKSPHQTRHHFPCPLCLELQQEHVTPSHTFSLVSDWAAGWCTSASFLQGRKILIPPASVYPATLTSFPLELPLLALGRKKHPTGGEEIASQHELSTSPKGQDGPNLTSCLHRDIGKGKVGRRRAGSTASE